MSIPVTCPSCMTRFNVSEKFAGKSGPCPKCQKAIKIPEKSEEVVIHAPQESGPTDSKGRSVLKPLRRKEVALSIPAIMAAGLGTLVVFGLALGLGLSGDQPPTALLAASSFLLAVPLVLVGYWFLHDDELQGYAGKTLWIRGLICSAGFAVTWGVYAFVPAYLSGNASMAEISGAEMALFIASMIAIGTIVSVLAFELEIMQGLLHYMFYFAITFALTWLAGTQLSQPLSRDESSSPPQPPAITAPAGAPKPPASPMPLPAEGVKKPNLLQ